MQKIYAVDFDGTITKENVFPLLGEPNKPVIDHIKQLQKHNIIILWTCRCGKHLDEAIAFCAEVGIRLDYVNKNVPELIEKYGNDCRKIFADYYIDDKAINASDICTDKGSLHNA